MPFYPFLGEGSPTKIDYRKKGTLILASLLEDLLAVLTQCGFSAAPTALYYCGWTKSCTILKVVSPSIRRMVVQDSVHPQFV